MKVLNMPTTLTLNGNASILTANYFPSITLEQDYECSLIDFHIYNSIPNVDEDNNLFHVGDNIIEISIGSYELEDIADFLESEYGYLTKGEKSIKIEANNNTMRVEITTSHDKIFFDKDKTIGKLMGFNKKILNEIDRTRYLGISSTIKNFLSLNDSESIMMGNASWSYDKDIDVGEGLEKTLKFQFKILVGEFLILNTIKIINSGNVLPVAFRSWDCHYHPQLSTSQNHVWNGKLAANRERPRFVLIAFQHENKLTHCNLNNIKLYPYDDLNVKFDNQRYAILYDMYFQPNFYIGGEPQTSLSDEHI
ncbi:hypothetical protein CVS40_11477 [Lucilia cuprina]|nr:hypothetical protein CVS40_11477 [Lucilia cuprina]